MNGSDVSDAIGDLLDELLRGSHGDGGWVLNPGDPGLLSALDRLSASEASRAPAGGGASVAAHVDHLRYGLQLLNRWSQGENAFATADYSASWRRGEVAEQEWADLRSELAGEAERWRNSVRTPRTLDPVELRGVIASVAHLAYHLGAIRQVERRLAGPAAAD